MLSKGAGMGLASHCKQHVRLEGVPRAAGFRKQVGSTCMHANRLLCELSTTEASLKVLFPYRASGVGVVHHACHPG